MSKTAPEPPSKGLSICQQRISWNSAQVLQIACACCGFMTVLDVTCEQSRHFVSDAVGFLPKNISKMKTKPFTTTASLIACCLLVPCRAQTEHKSGWASGIAAQLAAPVRKLHAENDHKWDMHDPIKLYANKVCTREVFMMSLQHM